MTDKKTGVLLREINRDEWETVQLRDVGTWHKGSSFSKSEITSIGQYNVIHYGELFTTYDAIITKCHSRTNKDCPKGEINDILFPASDVTPDGLGRCSSLQVDDVILGGDIIILRPTVPLYSPFLSLAINAKREEIVLRATGTTVKHSKASALKTIEIKLPSIELQYAITSSIERINKQIVLLKNLISKQEAIKKATLKLLMTPKVGWREIKLGDIGEVLMCKRILKSQTSATGDIPFFKIGTFGSQPDAFISRSLFNEFHRRYPYPRKGEILLSAAGTIGRKVVFDGQNAYFQDSNIVWISNDEKLVINEFLYYCYSTQKWQTEDGGIVTRLYNNNLKAMKICVPSIQEQRKIANTLIRADEHIEVLKELLAKAEKIKVGTMKHFFG